MCLVFIYLLQACPEKYFRDIWQQMLKQLLMLTFVCDFDTEAANYPDYSS